SARSPRPAPLDFFQERQLKLKEKLTMPMPQRVQYPETIEPLVQFIEDTPPSEILDRTLDKLRAGVPTESMLTASVLAVTRSTEMPPGPHGGPRDPVRGPCPLSRTAA